jgi:hypothetical protein
MKVPLITGAYKARSLIAAAQRCVNLYAEKNPEGEEFPMTFYPTPGTIKKGSAGDYLGWRCLYTSTDNRLFGVVGQSVVMVLPTWTFITLGVIESVQSRCYMLDNGNQIIIVDGTDAGYTVNLETLEFAKITNEAFYGSSRIDLVDGYILLNRPGTKQWYISLINEADFDSLDFASKSGNADNLVAVASTRRNVFLFGEQTTEIWTNTGGAAFTFSRLSGAFIEFGCASADSIAQADGSLYWLSKSKEGHCMVLRSVNYDRERISTFAIENEFQTYSRVDDAYAYVHQMSGHYWYVITFPTANKTWVFDAATGEWHERAQLDSTGKFNRERAGCFTYWNGMHLIGDHESGAIYELRLDQYSDDGQPIRRVRSFPHMADDGNRVTYQQFQAAMEVGEGDFGAQPEIRLRWSDTKGASWGTSISSTLGQRGGYLKDCRFLRLGQARSRVFELSWSANCPTALNGAYIQIQQAAR